jgi:cytochrome c peroxidase
MRRAIHILSIIIIVCLCSALVNISIVPRPLHISYPSYFGNRIFIPDSNPTTEEGVYLGRMLFYETALSSGSNTSCATCHQQSLAFTDGKSFSEGTDGAKQPRNTMSLANLLWVNSYFWDGRANGLEEQAITPLTSLHEMDQSLEVSAARLKQQKQYREQFKKAFGSDSITGNHIIRALAQFERTLVSANSRYDKYLQGKYQPTSSELNGIALFYGSPDPAKNKRGASCDRCHAGPKTFSERFHNNGLDSIAKDEGRASITGQAYDKGRFRVVTLRNIALTAPYMHDARFETLEEVVSHYNEHIAQSKALSIFLQNNSNTINGKSLDLTEQEKKDIVSFLHMLTDSTFITDKRFSNPFIKR